MFRIIKLGTTEKLILAITTSRFSSGAKYTASSITATFYKVNGAGDALEIDTAIGTSGVVTLAADTGGKTGFHSTLLDVSGLTAKIYCVVYEATVDSVAAISSEFLDVDAERKKIADYVDAAISAVLEDTGTTLPTTLTAIAQYIDTEVQAIIDALGNGTYGLSALNTDLDALLARLTALRAGYLDNLSGGASALDSTVAKEATLTAIKGVGWTTETLKAIYDLGGGATVLPVMQGTVYSTFAAQKREVELSRGDTISRLTFDLGADYTGYTPYFGAKESPDDTTYVINPKACTWTDITAGEGYVSLTATELGTKGKLYAEVELRNDVDATTRLTAIKFVLRIVEDIVK